MRFLVDECTGPAVAEWLRGNGFVLREKVCHRAKSRRAGSADLCMIEVATDAAKLVSVFNYDGMPIITADTIFRQIKGKMEKEI